MYFFVFFEVIIGKTTFQIHCINKAIKIESPTTGNIVEIKIQNNNCGLGTDFPRFSIHLLKFSIALLN